LHSRLFFPTHFPDLVLPHVISQFSVSRVTVKILGFFLFVIFLTAPARGQRVDTTQIIRLLALEKQIDSLTGQLVRMRQHDPENKV
jgi:hypothetical protein